MNNTFHCSNCDKDHEVYRRLDVGGKENLCYICPGIRHQTTDKAGNVILKSLTMEQKYLRDDLDGPFREVWSPALAKQKQAEKQFQLLMMHEQPKRS